MSEFGRRTFLIAAVLIATSSFAAAADSYLRQAEQRIFDLANEARKDAGVEPLPQVSDLIPRRKTLLTPNRPTNRMKRS